MSWRPRQPADGALAVVTGPDGQAVRQAVASIEPDAAFYEQTERLGTAHAVLAAREAIAQGYDDILVLFGDTPLMRPETLAAHAQGLPKAPKSSCWASAPKTRPAMAG